VQTGLDVGHRHSLDKDARVLSGFT
jgi:hypothetical protein